MRKIKANQNRNQNQILLKLISKMWIKNKKEGKEKLVYPNGNGSYIGEFQNNMFNGAGIETIQDENYKKVEYFIYILKFL